MLNHIWLALIVIGILTAAGRDIHDAVQNSYGNGIPWRSYSVELDSVATAGSVLSVSLRVPAEEIDAHFPGVEASEALFTSRIMMQSSREGSAALRIDASSPERFRTMAKALGNEDEIMARIRRLDDGWELRFENVSLVYLKSVTNAAFEIAGTAVSIAIGLIGIMAMWLGVMRVAEQAGLITRLAGLVRPLTRRIFPDVPQDHPAIGSMIMNISANMLGLGNAATPFGLKAMEELNKLNSKSGVATDAMVTFLALNTSCVTLIPATAIAVRAAAGSADPAIIIGTSFLASLTATICAVVLSKLLSRVRMFRWDRSEAT